jgi:hypothetical protein
MSAVLRRLLRLSLLGCLLAAVLSSCSDDDGASPEGPQDGRVQVVFSVERTDGSAGVAAITYVDHGGTDEVPAIATPWKTGTLDIPPGTALSLEALSSGGDTADLTCTITVDGVDTTMDGAGSCSAAATAEPASS